MFLKNLVTFQSSCDYPDMDHILKLGYKQGKYFNSFVKAARLWFWLVEELYRIPSNIYTRNVITVNPIKVGAVGKDSTALLETSRLRNITH